MGLLGSYIINESDIVPSQSGNALVALFNDPDSGRLIRVKNVVIQNFRRDAIGTSTQLMADYVVQKITDQTVGKIIAPVKLDTSDGSLPSQIKCFGGGNPTYATTALSFAALGNLTFTNNGFPTRDTIARSAGDWLLDGVIPGTVLTFSSTVNNNTSYVVHSATASTVTVVSGQDVVGEVGVAGAVSGVIPSIWDAFMIKHQFFATTANSQFTNFNIGAKNCSTGTKTTFMNNYNGGSEPMSLAAGEGISVKLRQTQDLDAAAACKEFHTYIVECIFRLDSGEVYSICEYLTPEPENGNFFSILNGTGSGKVVTIYSINVGEAGDTSTPYFMLVPFDYIESLAQEETIRTITPLELDTNSIALGSSVVCKKDVVIYPKGFSSGSFLFPLSFGSAVPAVGINYLITKDFYGPIYASFFPEKSELTGNSGINVVVNQLLSKSHLHQSIFDGDDLYLSPGEGLAIVAAAEPLSSIGAGTAGQVNKYAMGKYDFSLIFDLESPVVSITISAQDAVDFTNIENARVYLTADVGGDLPNGTVIINDLTDVNGEVSLNFDYTSNQPVVGRVRRSTSPTLYKTSPLSGTITQDGLSLTAFMIRD